MNTRRRLIILAGSAAALPALSRIATAQGYPARPLRLVVGFPPGGAADMSARLIGQWLSERLGQQWIVENRSGAGTNIATEAVVRAAPDGYTLLLVSAANTINATLYTRLNFDFIRDITPVASLIQGPLVMQVHPSVPVSSVPEFIAYAKANPNKINMASAGTGTPGHLSGELFKMMTGINLVHVPYRGGALALSDLIAGQVQVMFDNLPTSLEHIRADKVRPLAVTTLTRSRMRPDLPTVAEYVPGYEVSSWFGIGAPRNTPREIVDKLNEEINISLSDPKMKAQIAEWSSVPMIMTPAEFGKFIAEETNKWSRIIRLRNIINSDPAR
jgi:tripartite-type tricarboxylate transporter receptor subunit TctC